MVGSNLGAMAFDVNEVSPWSLSRLFIARARKLLFYVESSF